MQIARALATLWTFVTVLLGGPASTSGRSPAHGGDTFVLVPYPESLHLVEVLDGTRRTTPRAHVLDQPDTWAGLPAFGPRDGLELVERARGGLARVARLIAEMRALAEARVSTFPGPDEIDLLEGAFRRDWQRLDLLTRRLAYRGVDLLASAREIYVHRSTQAPLLVELARVTPAALDLPTSIASFEDALNALYRLFPALQQVERADAGLGLVERELRDGPPDGGLREVERILARMKRIAEQCSLGSLNTSERLLLDEGFRADLERLDLVAEGAHFQGLRGLLDGGRVHLQGAPPASEVLLHILPDVTSEGLRLSTWIMDVTGMTSATLAVVKLEHALETVMEHREDLLEVRERLADGLRFP